VAIYEVIVKFKGRVLFKQYIPKKCKRFGIKMFKLCDSTGYTYDMNVYLGKGRQRAEQHLTATHSTVTSLTKGVEGFGHKLHMDSFFSSPDPYDDLAQKNILCCGTCHDFNYYIFAVCSLSSAKRNTFMLWQHYYNLPNMVPPVP